MVLVNFINNIIVLRIFANQFGILFCVLYKICWKQYNIYSENSYKILWFFYKSIPKIWKYIAKIESLWYAFYVAQSYIET